MAFPILLLLLEPAAMWQLYFVTFLFNSIAMPQFCDLEHIQKANVTLFPFHLLKPGIWYAALYFSLSVPFSFAKHPERTSLPRHTAQRQVKNKSTKSKKLQGFTLALSFS